MTSKVVLILAAIFIITTRMVNGRDLTSWVEEIGGGYFTKSKHKYGIPFTSRSTEVTFPNDFPIQQVRNLTSNQIGRGIRHYNDVKDPDCKPILKISKGGLNLHFATLSIKSKKGCAIDSTVGFTTERI